MRLHAIFGGLAVALAGLAGLAQADDFAEGRKLFQERCLSCHDARLDPPVAPPMFGVQMFYRKAHPSREAFVEAVADFVRHPSRDKALLTPAVKRLGVMPAQDIGDREARLIAAYIHDERFPPPCAHWKAGMKKALAEGDMEHYRMDKARYERMCGEGEQASDKGGSATLRRIMRDLGSDYAALNDAILKEDFALAAEAAGRIARHPRPGMGERMRLMRALGDEIRGFKAADRKVHKLALEVEDAAKRRDMKALIERQSRMLGACMACHVGYRARVVEILRGRSSDL